MKTLAFQGNGHTIERQVEEGAEILVVRSEDGAPPELRAEAGRGEAKRYTLTAGLRTLSQRHARIRVTDTGALEVEDLGSRNGTFVRILPGKSREFAGKTEILLGRELSVQTGGSSWLLPEDDGIGKRPEDLVALLEHRLRDLVHEVRISKSSEPVDTSLTRLPLAPGSQILIAWKSGTSDVDAEQWLRAVVSLFNSQSGASRLGGAPWVFIGASQPRAQVLALAQRIAAADCSVLIRGATGSGKDVLANDIHNHSLRVRGPFIAINCSAVPEALFESELFGHARGAFTNAAEARVGLIELAHGGTLFLDELGELPHSMQAKLLRFLEDHKVRPIGGRTERRVDVRILAATNSNLEKMVSEGKFREDLLYRLNTVQLTIPALQPLDVQVLSHVLLKRLAEAHSVDLLPRERDQLAQRAATVSWPGGARQLRGALERYFLLRDPQASVAENWQTMLDAGSQMSAAPARPANPRAVSSSAAPAPPGLAQAPLAAARLLDNILFLATAKATLEQDPRSGVSEIAGRVGLTYQGVVNRLRNLNLKLDGQGDLAKLTERFQEEHSALSDYLPWLRAVLWTSET